MNSIIAGIAAVVVGAVTYFAEPQYELGPELVDPYAHVIPNKEPELVNPYKNLAPSELPDNLTNPYKNISPKAVPTGLVNPYIPKEETPELMPFDSI